MFSRNRLVLRLTFWKLSETEFVSTASSSRSEGIWKDGSIIPNIPLLLSLKTRLLLPKFSQFVSDSILLYSGWSRGTAVWGPVHSQAPPRLVLPLTVEPSKPRLYHDERYLNLWIRDLPFKLDHLCDLPRYVLPGLFQSTCDDKNGYQCLASSFVSNLFWLGMVSFSSFVPSRLGGNKASAFIYHKLDDRHVGQLFTSPLRVSRNPSL